MGVLSQLFLAFVKIHPSVLISSSGRLAKTIPRHKFVQLYFFSLVHVVQF